MKAIKQNESFKVYVDIPEKWKGIKNYNALSPEWHFSDGWRDIVVPNISEHQKMGKLIVDGDKVTYQVLEMTQEEIEALVEFKKKEVKAEIMNKYEFHKLNGWEFYQSFRARIIVDIYSGKITETHAFQIEEHLKDGFDKISNTGDWKTAYFILSKKIQVDKFITPYEEEAMNEIALYIKNNYEN